MTQRQPMWLLVAAAILVVLFVGTSSWSVQAASHRLSEAATRIEATLQRRHEVMNYSKIVFKNAEGEVIDTYISVTGYTSSDEYVSFSGIKQGTDPLLDWEINRSTFATVEKYP